MKEEDYHNLQFHSYFQVTEKSKNSSIIILIIECTTRGWWKCVAFNCPLSLDCNFKEWDNIFCHLTIPLKKNFWVSLFQNQDYILLRFIQSADWKSSQRSDYYGIQEVTLHRSFCTPSISVPWIWWEGSLRVKLQRENKVYVIFPGE